MGKSRARAKRARERKRAANQAAKAERRAADVRPRRGRGRDLRRQVAHSEAIAFVKLFMPRAERTGAFRNLC